MATQTIRSGETASQATPAIMKSTPVKTYHHIVRGAKFVMPDGLEVQFLGGSFTTADPEIIAELVSGGYHRALEKAMEKIAVVDQSVAAVNTFGEIFYKDDAAFSRSVNITKCMKKSSNGESITIEYLHTEIKFDYTRKRVLFMSFSEGQNKAVLKHFSVLSLC